MFAGSVGCAASSLVVKAVQANSSGDDHARLSLATPPPSPIARFSSDTLTVPKKKKLYSPLRSYGPHVPMVPSNRVPVRKPVELDHPLIREYKPLRERVIVAHEDAEKGSRKKLYDQVVHRPEQLTLPIPGRITVIYTPYLPPHFTLEFDRYIGSIAIQPAKVLVGDFSEKIKNLLVKWTKANQATLLRYWQIAKNAVPSPTIPYSPSDSAGSLRPSSDGDSSPLTPPPY